MAAISSNKACKSRLCIKDLALEKAVQHVKVDEATSFQANQFSFQVNKTAASAYKKSKSHKNSDNNSTPPCDMPEDNPRKCKFCMRLHVFRKELCPAKDSICKACNTKGHWAKSLMCHNKSKAGAKQPTEDRKSDAHAAQSSSTGNPSLQFISADGKSPVSQSASVKTINLSGISSVGTHCYAAFVLGNHNWIQHCMVDPGANINCVGYDWITHFETPQWNYKLECGSVKAAGGHNLKVEARVLLKRTQRTQSCQLINGFTLSMVRMELFLALLPAELLVS